MLWCWLSLIQGVTAEIKLRGALDRTAAELSLLSPLCSLLEDQSVQESDLDQLLAGMLPGLSLTALARDLALDSTSTLAMGQAIQQRLAYWLDEAEAGQPGPPGSLGSAWRRQLTVGRLFLDWQLERQQLWLCLTYSLRTPLGPAARSVQCVVPLWIGRGERAATKQNYDDIWLLDSFTRGQTFRTAMGGDLPYDFPVIAHMDGGTAVSIKSLDLTAPTYSQASAFSGQVVDYIERLAGFSGADYNKGGQQISISADAIQSRRLVLVVPENGAQDYLTASLAELASLATSRGVVLDVVRAGTSTRYAEG
jgi:hypothetical protein